MRNLRSMIKAITNKPIEIIAGGLLGLGVAFSVSYLHELKRDVAIPLGFSEISKLEERASASGKPIGELTHYYAALNDGLMNIFECWNDSYENSGRSIPSFAQHLHEGLDPRNKKYRHNLGSYILKLETGQSSGVYIPELASSALKRISDLMVVMNSLPEVSSKFNNSWNSSHVDHTHLEPKVSISKDSDGHETTSTSLVEVYDNTTHSYTYNSNIGESASKGLDAMISSMPNLYYENLTPSQEVQKANRDAILKSRIARDKNTKINDNDFFSISANWATGSTYHFEMDQIHSAYSSLKDNANLWRSLKNTSTSTSYVTTSRSSAGPEGFQVCTEAAEECDDIVSRFQILQDSIGSTFGDIPKLEKEIYAFISMPPEKMKGKEGINAAESIVDSAEQIYHLNFRNGFDVARFRPLAVAGWSVVGLLAGLGLGLGASKLLEKKNFNESVNWRF